MKTTDTRTVTIGKTSFQVGALPLGKLAVVIPAVTRALEQMKKTKTLDEEGMKDALTAICESVAHFAGGNVEDLKKTVTGDMTDILNALMQVAFATGVLIPKDESEPDSGEASAQAK